MQLGLAILLDDDGHNLLRRLQIEVARRWGPNPAVKQTPHVTLKQPFHARTLPPIEAYFDSLVRTVPPLALRVSGIAAFPDDGVIYLAVASDPALEALRQQVLRDLQERFRVKPRDVEDARYRFHASIAYNLPPERFVPAWEALCATPVELTFRLETLGLFYYTGEDWITYKRSRLAAAGAP